MKKLLVTIGLIATTVGAAFAFSYNVYKEPNNQAQVIDKISDQSPNHYSGFYQEGDWVKVANTADGKVGWVNAKTIQSDQKQQALKLMDEQRQQLAKQREYFEQNYQKTVAYMKKQMDDLHRQMHSDQAPKASDNKVTDKDQQKPVIKESFKSIMIKSNDDGKTATVTKQWLGKDGKMHKDTKQVPQDKLHNISLSIEG